MGDFSLAKITVFFVSYVANYALLPSISTANTMTLSHRKFHSDLFRGPIKAFTVSGLGDLFCIIRYR